MKKNQKMTGPKKATPMQQLMLMFHNREEMFIITSALSVLSKEVQEDISLSLVAYLRFGVRRASFPNSFSLGLFENLVTYLDFTRGKDDAIPVDDFTSPLLYSMGEWNDRFPDQTVMFDDNSKHQHTYQDLIDCYPQLADAIRKDGHKPTDLVEYD